jgi:hypothetical protein
MADYQVNSRIKAIKDYAHLNNRQFASKISATAVTVGDIVHDKIGVGTVVLNRIFEAFPEVSAEWVLTGIGKMLKTEDIKLAEELENHINEGKLCHNCLRLEGRIEEQTAMMENLRAQNFEQAEIIWGLRSQLSKYEES